MSGFNVNENLMMEFIVQQKLKGALNKALAVMGRI